MSNSEKFGGLLTSGSSKKGFGQKEVLISSLIPANVDNANVQACINESPLGLIRKPVKILSARKYSFVPKGKQESDRVSGVTLEVTTGLIEIGQMSRGLQIESFSILTADYEKLYDSLKEVPLDCVIEVGYNERRKKYDLFNIFLMESLLKLEKGGAK